MAVKVTHAERAYVVDSFPVGLQLRTRGDDTGLTLGGSKRRYIFDPNVSEKLHPGWHLFFTNLPGEHAVAVHAQSVGIEFGFDGNAINGTIGFLDRAGIRAKDTESVVLNLDYEPARPEKTKAGICGRERKC